MTLQTVSLKKMQENNGVFILLYGVPGSGKTASIRGFPKENTAIICSEAQGLVTLSKFGWEGAKVLCPRTFDEFSRGIEECLGDNSINHIVVDTLSQMYDLFMKAYVESSGKSVSSIGIDAYRVCGLQFQKMFRRILDALPMGKDVIGMVHLKYREEVDGDTKKNIREPDLPGALPQFVSRTASLVLRADKVKAGKDIKYVLCSDATEGSYAKDVWGVMTDSVKDNDLWSLLKTIRSQIPVCKQNGNTEGISSYADLLRLGIKHKVSKTDVDALLSSLEVDARSTSPDKWVAVYAAFKSKYVAEF
jgi:hypothetical protein